MRRRPLFVRALTSVRFVLVKKGNKVGSFEFGGSATVVYAEKGRNKVRPDRWRPRRKICMLDAEAQHVASETVREVQVGRATTNPDRDPAKIDIIKPNGGIRIEDSRTPTLRYQPPNDHR